MLHQGKIQALYFQPSLSILSDLTVVIMPVVFNIAQMSRARFNHRNLSPFPELPPPQG